MMAVTAAMVAARSLYALQIYRLTARVWLPSRSKPGRSRVRSVRSTVLPGQHSVVGAWSERGRAAAAVAAVAWAQERRRGRWRGVAGGWCR